MNAYAIGILISILVYLVVGNYAGRKVKHLEDYFVAGRQAPTLLIVGTLVASLMSTNAFLGETGMGYSGYGSLIVIVTALNVLGYVAGAVYFGRFLRRSQALTVAEYFGRRFDSHRVRMVAGITIIIGVSGYLMAVTQGASLILSEVTEMPYRVSLCVVWAGYTLFTLYSGSRGVIITDTIMFLLFSVVAFVALGFIVDAAGGWFTAVRELATFEPKSDIISWHGHNGPDSNWHTPAESLTWAVILGLAWGVVVAVSPWQASRYLMAKNEHVVIRSACGTAAAVMVLYLVLQLAGAAINLSKADIEPAQEAMIWAALNLMPTAAGTLLMAGIMAAALSSASTFLSLIGFSTSHDIVRHDMSDDRKLLRASRITMFGVSLVALALALIFPPQIFWLTYFVGTVFASSWGPVAFMSVWSKKITAAAAFWGIVVGFLGNIGANLLEFLNILDLPVFLDPILVGAALSLAAIFLVSRQGTVSPAEHEFLERIHETPAAEFAPDEYRRTQRWPKLLILAGVATTTLMIVFYASPYQDAVHGEVSFLSGEHLLSIGCGLMLVLCGVVAHTATKRSYPPAIPANEFEAQ